VIKWIQKIKNIFLQIGLKMSVFNIVIALLMVLAPILYLLSKLKKILRIQRKKIIDIEIIWNNNFYIWCNFP